MLKLRSVLLTLFKKRSSPEDKENASVGAIVRLLKPGRGKATDDKDVPPVRPRGFGESEFR